jgi:hypothetical protein
MTLMDTTILFWNEVALEANKVSHSNGKNEQTGPPLSARALAIVHIAMHDAYFGIAGGQLTYTGMTAGSGDPHGAVASAAHATLAALYPSQKEVFDAKLAEFCKCDVFGTLVAQKILELRSKDPGVGAENYSPKQGPGKHRTDPDTTVVSYHAPFYGAHSTLFAATGVPALTAPPAVGTPAYNTALTEVRGRGIKPELMGTLPATFNKRTADETVVGIYWGYDGAVGLGTPPRLYNKIVRKFAVQAGCSTSQNARLFALVNVALADAGILAWKEKYTHEFWRPVLGIREHNDATGPEAKPTGASFAPNADTGWLPLGAPASNSTGKKNFTPDFPAYPSGHATFGAASLDIARRFLKAEKLDTRIKDFCFVSSEFDGMTRDNQGTARPRHTRLFAGNLDAIVDTMIAENGLSRIYLGVHWSFDAYGGLKPNGSVDTTIYTGGIPLGLKISESVFNNKLMPTKTSPAC